MESKLGFARKMLAFCWHPLAPIAWRPGQPSVGCCGAYNGRYEHETVKPRRYNVYSRGWCVTSRLLSFYRIDGRAVIRVDAEAQRSPTL